MIDLLVRAGLVVTMDGGRSVIADGAVAIHDGRIVACGAHSEIAGTYTAKREAGGPDFIALPGFVDGHSHAGHALVRTIGAEDFPVWREACRKIYMEGAPLSFWRAEARLSALERLKAGVTTAAVYLGGGDENNRSDSVGIAEAYTQAFTDHGPRIVLGIGPTRPPFPRRYAHAGSGETESVSVDFAQQVAVCRQAADTLPSDTVRVAFTAPVVNPVIHRDDHFDEICAIARTMKDLAREYQTLLMVDGHRTGTVAFADRELGILDERTLLSHVIGITPEEIEILARTGAVVSNNAMSASAIWGRCPVPELMAAGVRVFLSSDGLAPDGSCDMFDVMRAAMRYHRAQMHDTNVLPPGRALSMTTIEPAIALGLGADVGSLEAGKRADLALINMRKPHLWPGSMPLYQLLTYGNAQDVDTVIIGGRVAMEGRSVPGEDEILATALEESERMLDRTGLRHLLETPPDFWADRYDRPVRDGINHIGTPQADRSPKS